MKFAFKGIQFSPYEVLTNPNPITSKVFASEILRNPKLKKRVFEKRLQKISRESGNRDENIAESRIPNLSRELLEQRKSRYYNSTIKSQQCKKVTF